MPDPGSGGFSATVGEGSEAWYLRVDDIREWMAHFNDPEGRPFAIMAQVKA